MLDQSSKHIAYFDNAATTFPKPEEVYSFMDKFYRTNGVNVGRGSYNSANTASALAKETRELLLQLFHCEGKTVIFEPSATIALNQVIRGLKWRRGQIVYITPFEHNAVLRPLNYLKREYDLKIIQLAVNRQDISYDLEKIKYQFQENHPDVVIVSHASNVCGVVAPIEDIFPIAKKYRATTIVDMSQTAGLIDTNLIDVQADYAVFAGHKTLYGPFGIAGFISTGDTELFPLIYGGTGIESANSLMPDQLPIKYEAGSQNIMAIAGLNASLKWILKKGVNTIYTKEQNERSEIIKILNKYSYVKAYIPFTRSLGIVCFNVEGYSCESLTPFFDNSGVACRTGLQCSPLAHKFLGTFPSGAIRLSLGYFNKVTDLTILNQSLSYLSDIIE